MAKCPKCNKEFEPCRLCRGQYPHQICVDDDICHECFMIENPNGKSDLRTERALKPKECKKLKRVE